MKTKRIIALALVLIMALSAIPFSVSANEPATVDVSYVDTNGTLISGAVENVFDGHRGTNYVGKGNIEGLKITGKLAAETVISKIIFAAKSSHSGRVRNSYVYASVDGYNWVQIGQNTKTSEQYDSIDASGNYIFEIAITDTTAYRYIRYVQPDGYKTYDVGLSEIEVVGVTQAATVDVSLVGANGTYDQSTYGAYENVFDGDVNTSCITKNATLGVSFTGILEDYTVISQIILTVDTSRGNRTKSSYIEASADGETWTKIATNSTDFNDNNDSFVFPLAVTDTTAYRYIRFRQGDGYYAWDLGIAEIEVKGFIKSNLLDVSLNRANENHENTTTVAENVFDGFTSTNYIAKNTNEGVVIEGRLNGKYRLSSIALTVVSGNYINRTSEATIEASVDGKTWVQVGQQLASNLTTYTVEITDTTPYRYVRFCQAYRYRNYPVGLVEFEVKGVPVHSISVTGTEFYNSDGRDMSNVFKNTGAYTAGQSKNGEMYGIGQLEEPTQITRVTVRAADHDTYCTSARYMKISASVNGTDWVLLATCPYSMGRNEEKIFTVENDGTFYNYIKFEQDSYCASQSWWFRVGGILVDGVTLSETNTAMARGMQIADAGDKTFSARFLATVGDVSEYNAVGMEINATTQDGTKKRFVVNAFNVYTSVIGLVDGVETTIKAGEGVLAGGKYVYTVVVENIPSDCGLVTFDVTPYIYLNGERVDSEAVQYVLDGADEAVMTTYDLKQNEDKIKVQGRSYELEQGIACDFTASGIEFNALCAGDVKITANCSATTYYTVYINGVRSENRLTMNSGTGTYTVVENLPAGVYNVKLVKQTHVAHSLSALISVQMNGEITNEASADNEYLIEFIGDSITCGYGTVNYPENGVTYYGTSYYCDATEAYAYKTADMLGTDYSMVSVSGWAVLAGGSSIPSIYGKTSWQRGEDEYVPTRKADIVVINLGTNDKGYSNYATDFVSQSVEFIADIRTMHGEDVTIIWAYGAMMKDDALTTFEGYLEQIVDQTGIRAVQIQYDQSAGNGHPSAAGHTASAEILANYITENNLLG